MPQRPNGIGRGAGPARLLVPVDPRGGALVFAPLPESRHLISSRPPFAPRSSRNLCTSTSCGTPSKCRTLRCCPSRASKRASRYARARPRPCAAPETCSGTARALSAPGGAQACSTRVRSKAAPPLLRPCCAGRRQFFRERTPAAAAHTTCVLLLALAAVTVSQDPNQLIRASALRVLSSIRVDVIVPIVEIAINTASVDMSPYVRKCAAHAIPKLVSYVSPAPPASNPPPRLCAQRAQRHVPTLCRRPVLQCGGRAPSAPAQRGFGSGAGCLHPLIFCGILMVPSVCVTGWRRSAQRR